MISLVQDLRVSSAHKCLTLSFTLLARSLLKLGQQQAAASPPPPPGLLPFFVCCRGAGRAGENEPKTSNLGFLVEMTQGWMNFRTCGAQTAGHGMRSPTWGSSLL